MNRKQIIKNALGKPRYGGAASGRPMTKAKVGKGKPINGRIYLASSGRSKKGWYPGKLAGEKRGEWYPGKRQAEQAHPTVKA